MRTFLGLALAVVAFISSSSAEPFMGNLAGIPSASAAVPPAAPGAPSSSAAANPFGPRPSVACATPNPSCMNLNSQVMTAVNLQIELELTMSYQYLAMSSYFAQDTVALRGFAKFFKSSYSEEQSHANSLIEYLISRGGTVSYANIPAPASTSWASPQAAVNAALALEKTVNAALLDLHWMAQQGNDPHLQDLLESSFLDEQVKAIYQLARFSTILGSFNTNPVGPFIFDEALYAGTMS